MRTRLRLVGVVVAATAVLLSTPIARADQPERDAPPPCAGSAAPDEWPTFGRDLANTRLQTEAGDLSTATAPTLQPAWTYTTGSDASPFGDFNGTPIVSGGCVFLNAGAGDVIALDSATGAEVWRTNVPLEGEKVAGLGGLFVSSPAVWDDLVLALVNQTDAPYAIALDISTGEEVWRSEYFVESAGYYTNATAIVTEDGLLLAGFSPEEGDPAGQGGLAIIDAKHGTIKDRVYAIPDEDQDEYAGGGIWTAPAIDDDGYAYAGTSNPYSKKIEHPNTNAILKIDVKRGEVVDSYKGLIEQYHPAVREAVDPTCEAFGEDPNLQLIVGDSAPCLQLDLDFGSPPTLYTDSNGDQIVADLQKAGVLHAVNTETMDASWTQIVGVSCAACNAAAWAHDGAGHLVGASSPVGTMVAVGADDGELTWASPIGDGTHYQATSIAGGVAYTIDNAGALLAWDVETGIPLLRRPMQADLGADGVAAAVASSGVAIASGMVIAANGTGVVAYAPPA